ncbi:GerAB/ArcD/ProY family transporter [Natranaerobius thermophilus]|uniref:Spore germination protein n=1 Tax=Natranaerobius thermophilus (strain ATCC BAA-1301 / DSM 18059 / JW/NM-WN-LF) TaxID=457570 RepID=B2A6R5_NATTJ|nr:endospore germination permease [Natranaerobius thermophilus]ACB84198.1 spore germination protein [Natranaerobius thermophilus JW/NM-WN-LF]
MLQEKIANRQLLFMIFLVRATIAIAFLPVLTTGNAGQDAWLATIIMTFTTVALIFLVVGLGIKFPEQTIVEYSQDLLGKYPGKLITLLILWFFLHMAATEVRIYGELLNIAFLPRTPLVFVIGAMVFLAAITVYIGVEVLGRMADLLFPFYIFLIGISILLPLPELVPENFEPVLAGGLTQVMSSALTPTAIGSQVLVVTILLPRVVEPKKGIKTIIVAFTAANLLVLLISIAVIGKLGSVEGAKAVFPFLLTIRALELSEYIERLEIFAVLAWGMGIYISLSVYLYCGAKGLSQWFGLRDYRPLTFPMAIVWVVMAMHSFESIFQIRNFFAPEVFFPYAMTGFLPFILLWVSYVFKKLTKSN